MNGAAVTRRRNVRRRRHGVGLVELLVALAISASLLTATAVAIDASFKAYEVNQEMSDLTQRTRLAMYRITSMIRQTREHAPQNAGPSGEFAGGKVVDDSGIEMFDVHGNEVSYRYDAANKRLVAVFKGTPHTLCEGVEAFNVRFEPMRSATSIKTGGPWDLLKRATLILTVKTTNKTATKGEGVGKQTMTLSASVMPRRNAW